MSEYTVPDEAGSAVAQHGAPQSSGDEDLDRAVAKFGRP
jgi:hypothetical protein